MRYTPETLGAEIRRVRTGLGVTQTELATACGTRQRFISDLENGKPTCEIGKVLRVLNTLGIEVKLTAPGGAGLEE